MAPWGRSCRHRGSGGPLSWPVLESEIVPESCGPAPVPVVPAPLSPTAVPVSATGVLVSPAEVFVSDTPAPVSATLVPESDSSVKPEALEQPTNNKAITRTATFVEARIDSSHCG